jgi:PAS domain S-box-containing protein
VPGYHLFLRVDLAQPLAARLDAGRGEIWREAGMTLLFAALLAVLLHVLWFRRAARITAAVAALGAGRMEARAGLAGRDELATIGTAIDRMAAELQQRQAQLRQLASLIEHSPVVAIAWRNAPGWPVSFVSDNVAEWGHAPEELRSGRLEYADLIHPEDRPRIEAEVAGYFAHGPDHYIQEYRLRRADGQWLWIKDRSWLTRAADGTVTAIQGVLLDISESRRLREARRESEARYREVQRVAKIGGWELNLLDNQLWWSDEIFRIFEVDPERFAASYEAFLGMVHPADRERVDEAYQKSVANREPYEIVHRLRFADGRVKYVRERGETEYADDGQPLRSLGTVQDVTEQVLVEEQVRESETRYRTLVEEQVRQRTAELAAANQALETFSYSVSHDLKAPLRGIDGYSRLLLADYGDRLDEEGRLFLNNVRQGVARMNQLIEDLLAYSRMERRSLEPVSLNLEQEIGTVLAERAADIASRGMRVEMAVQGLAARVDPNGLTLALRNLLDNALKFTRDSHPPRLSIHGQSTGESIILSFQDNGIGFDMRFHDRIFEISQRLQRAEDYPGTGLGLAIASKAMQRMGGRVWAESAPGQGAAFYLELPR